MKNTELKIVEDALEQALVPDGINAVAEQANGTAVPEDKAKTLEEHHTAHLAHDLQAYQTHVADLRGQLASARQREAAAKKEGDELLRSIARAEQVIHLTDRHITDLRAVTRAAETEEA